MSKIGTSNSTDHAEQTLLDRQRLLFMICFWKLHAVGSETVWKCVWLHIGDDDFGDEELWCVQKCLAFWASSKDDEDVEEDGDDVQVDN